jgi:hypothetical protein
MASWDGLDCATQEGKCYIAVGNISYRGRRGTSLDKVRVQTVSCDLRLDSRVLTGETMHDRGI